MRESQALIRDGSRSTVPVAWVGKRGPLALLLRPILAAVGCSAFGLTAHTPNPTINSRVRAYAEVARKGKAHMFPTHASSRV